jgi:hypothetical protein
MEHSDAISVFLLGDLTPSEAFGKNALSRDARGPMPAMAAPNPEAKDQC